MILSILLARDKIKLKQENIKKNIKKDSQPNPFKLITFKDIYSVGYLKF